MTARLHSRPRTTTTAAALALACVFALGGCSTVKGWFKGKDKASKKAAEPAELVKFTPSLHVTELWSKGVGKGEKRIDARQAPVVADGRVYAAAVKGGVTALDLRTGAVSWHYDSDLPLSGGPGAGDGLVVVGSLEGDVVALDAASGSEKWKAKTGNEVIAPPVIGQGMVFVHGNDGRVTAFDAATGQRRWFWDHPMPSLTVRGNDGVVLGPGYAFVGNDDGTVTALGIADGHPLWDQTVAQPDGRTELDRMADVDGTPVLDGTTLYATSYKGKSVAIDAPSGRVMWSSDSGGQGRLGVGSDRLAVADAKGTVWALDKNSGAALWQQPALARRNLTSAAVQGNYAVVGDYDGYLHWLKLEDGAFAARLRLSHKALKGSPVVADNILVAQDVEGDIAAYSIGQ